jgi:glucose/arabinose dehydrogenase
MTDVLRTGIAAFLLVGAGLAQSLDDPRLHVDTWAGGLTRPVGFAHVGDDELLVVQNLDGRVLHLNGGTVVGTALDLLVSQQGGLGLVLDPGFAGNGFVYLYYATTASGEGGPWVESRLVRYTFDGASLGAPLGPLFTVPFDPAQANPSNHNSGLLRFGPDGKLYGQVGDKHRGEFLAPRIEQNTAASESSLGGGIFRLNPDGSVPADNPFASSAEPGLRPWFLYGFRNSLGMDFDPLTGTLWFGENGPTVYDEINRGASGMNSGWLKLMGPDAREATYAENLNTAFDESDLIQLPGSFYRDPEFSFLTPIGITALCFLDSKRFPPDLRGALLVGEAVNGQLYRFDLDTTRTRFALSGPLADLVADDDGERDLVRFGTGFGIVTEMHMGPDGYVWLANLHGGTIRRIRPLVDHYEPVEMTVQAGTLAAGTLAELELSDDERVSLHADGTRAFRERRTLAARMTLNESNPARIDVFVESRGNRQANVQRIQVRHVPSGKWHTVDVRPATIDDQVVSVLDLQPPGDYVDPAGNAVWIRVTHLSPNKGVAVLSGSAGAMPAPLKSDFDQIRLEVTWP